MTINIAEALKLIVTEKGLDYDQVLRNFEASLSVIFKKDFNLDGVVDVKIDEQRGGFKITSTWRVVEEVEDPEEEIALSDIPEESRDEFPVGSDYKLDIPTPNIKRSTIQKIKQEILQRNRDGERDILFEEYSQKLGTLITGKIQRKKNNMCFIDIGRTEAILPQREQVHRERYVVGDRLKVYILRVKIKENHRLQIVVSRSHPGFVRELFKQEVSEIMDGVVEIVNVSRDAGFRSKISVRSYDKNVDPVNACVGQRGMRVRSIVKELNNEKLDIVLWSEITEDYIRNALSPAETREVKINEDENKAVVIVPDNQLSLAIGKEGQNVRLAARLANWKIDIYSVSEMARVKAEEEFSRLQGKKKESSPLSELDGVGPKIEEALKKAGYTHVEKIASATKEDLSAIEGIGVKKAKQILKSAQNKEKDVAVPAVEVIESTDKEVNQERDKESADTAEGFEEPVESTTEEVETVNRTEETSEISGNDSKVVTREPAQKKESGALEDKPDDSIVMEPRNVV